MRFALLSVAAVLTLVLVPGCTGDSAGPLSPDDLAVAFNHSAEFCESRPNHPHCPPDDGEDPGNGDDPGDDGKSLATMWEIFDALADETTAAITGDGRAGGPYVDGECGVSSIVNVEGGSDDALLRTSWRRIHPRDSGACGGRDDRVYSVDLTGTVGDAPDRGVRTGTFGNINRVGRIAVGESTVDFGAVFNLSGCNLRAGRIKDGEANFPGTDDVEITAATDDQGRTTWTVESTGDHHALCVTDFGDGSADSMQGDLYVVPFRIVITDLQREPAFAF